MSDRCPECNEAPRVPETFRKPIHDERDDLHAEVKRLRMELGEMQKQRDGAQNSASFFAKDGDRQEADYKTLNGELARVTRERDEARERAEDEEAYAWELAGNGGPPLERMTEWLRKSQARVRELGVGLGFYADIENHEPSQAHEAGCNPEGDCVQLCGEPLSDVDRDSGDRARALLAEPQAPEPPRVVGVDLAAPGMDQTVKYRVTTDEHGQRMFQRVRPEAPEAQEVEGPMPVCLTCSQDKKPYGRDAGPAFIDMCGYHCSGYKEKPFPRLHWPGESCGAIAGSSSCLICGRTLEAPDAQPAREPDTAAGD